MIKEKGLCPLGYGHNSEPQYHLSVVESVFASSSNVRGDIFVFLLFSCYGSPALRRQTLKPTSLKIQVQFLNILSYVQAYELSIQFEPFYFLKKEDNLRNTIVYHTFVSYFNFWYLVQYVIYLFIHVQNIC